MNGFEATEYIRNTMHSTIPIIALTADVTTVDLRKCKEVGMNDYISKPVDEKLLYNKIVELLKKPMSSKNTGEYSETETEASLLFSKKRPKCIDLTYLNKHTKANPALMMEMITLYLGQTLPLISKMKQSLNDKDWESLHAAVHKMIPSFFIMGIHKDFEDMAKKVQEFASSQQSLGDIKELVLKLEEVCSQACEELKVEFELIKNKN
jgi:CheY-like chemotaxis protein